MKNLVIVAALVVSLGLCSLEIKAETKESSDLTQGNQSFTSRFKKETKGASGSACSIAPKPKGLYQDGSSEVPILEGWEMKCGCLVKKKK